MEVWRKIEGTHGLLEVSNTGEIKSLMRDGRILRQQPDKKGYMRVSVTVMRKKMTIKVHRAVAKAFLENNMGLPEVNHIDGNKKNNNVENLEWVTGQQNADHAIRTGLWGNVFKASRAENEKRKTPIKSTDVVSGEVRHFGSVSEAEKYFGTRHISDVLNGKRAKAAGNYFEREVVA